MLCHDTLSQVARYVPADMARTARLWSVQPGVEVQFAQHMARVGLRRICDDVLGVRVPLLYRRGLVVYRDTFCRRRFVDLALHTESGRGWLRAWCAEFMTLVPRDYTRERRLLLRTVHALL